MIDKLRFFFLNNKKNLTIQPNGTNAKIGGLVGL